MKTQRKFIKSIVAAATVESDIAMPWQRGARRAAFVAKRIDPRVALKRA
ncbi:hypothetical protein KUH32_08250 [Thalassococcus sp. CAU 1522]|uniref:Uncharacterized protein n=1 Tax=Thalassococcus arenae TaxID=2851652 RepID=A0ABS6N6X6_9RHOB|nr:hypothetical protein [Thalassococcus arenae]MBV2359763.1 hypothetical protein [Thalassococcus arenae]